jgi:hypothetical protein
MFETSKIGGFFRTSLVASMLLTMPLACFGENNSTQEKGAWVVFKDTARLFEISYPEGSIIVRDKPDYLRIQNYDPSKASGELEIGQYYLEIHFRNPKETCDGWIQNPKKHKVGKTVALIGQGDDEGDAGGFRFILCAARSQHLFSAVATDSNPSGATAYKILRSIKFGSSN